MRPRVFGPENVWLDMFGSPRSVDEGVVSYGPGMEDHIALIQAIRNMIGPIVQSSSEAQSVVVMNPPTIRKV